MRRSVRNPMTRGVPHAADGFGNSSSTSSRCGYRIQHPSPVSKFEVLRRPHALGYQWKDSENRVARSHVQNEEGMDRWKTARKYVYTQALRYPNVAHVALKENSTKRDLSSLPSSLCLGCILYEARTCRAVRNPISEARFCCTKINRAAMHVSIDAKSFDMRIPNGLSRN